MKTFNELFNSQRTEGDIFSIVSKAEEFEQVKVREIPVFMLRSLCLFVCTFSF